MGIARLTAAEAASLIKHGMNIGLSGFNPSHFEFNNPLSLINQVFKCVDLLQR